MNWQRITELAVIGLSPVLVLTVALYHVRAQDRIDQQMYAAQIGRSMDQTDRVLSQFGTQIRANTSALAGLQRLSHETTATIVAMRAENAQEMRKTVAVVPAAPVKKRGRRKRNRPRGGG